MLNTAYNHKNNATYIASIVGKGKRSTALNSNRKSYNNGINIVNYFILYVIILFLFSVISSVVNAEGLSGRIDRPGAYGYYPAVNVPVTLESQYRRYGPIYTDVYGMYYFVNIPAGDYILRVWPYPNRPPYNYSATVFWGKPMSTYPPIALP